MGDPLGLGGGERGLERGRDLVGDVILHREQIGELPVVLLRPERLAGPDVGQLHRDADPVAGQTHAAVDHAAHAQLAGHPLQPVARRVVLRRRRTPQHPQRGDPGELGGDLLGHPGAEVLPARYPARCCGTGGRPPPGDCRSPRSPAAGCRSRMRLRPNTTSADGEAGRGHQQPARRPPPRPVRRRIGGARERGGEGVHRIEAVRRRLGQRPADRVIHGRRHAGPRRPQASRPARSSAARR